MIKIFRNIRKKLIEHPPAGRAGSKVRSYLFYAIGEIILVVIGILIALQINNWNESKKARTYELTMLQEISNAIDTDLTFLNSYIPYLDSVQKSYYALAILKNDRLKPTDSLPIYLEKVREYGVLLNINTSPYEAIKSGGLDKISNITIRNQLSKLYGVDIPSTTSWTNEILRKELYLKMELLDKLFLIKQNPKNGSIIGEIFIDDANIIYDNEDFDKLLLTSWPLPLAINQLKQIRDSMLLLKQNIKKEIKNN
jgi:hypothetical protein